MLSRAAGLALALLSLGLVAWAPCRVRAQVEAGRRALDEADFQRALRAFDRAERTERLDRDALTSLYEGRAMARFALGDEAGARADLRSLGSLDPQHRFPAEAPPELGALLRELVRAAGGGLSFALRWSSVTGGSALLVEVQHDAASLVRAVRIHTRVGVRGRWRAEEARSVVVTHPPGVRVYFHVQAIGPGGAILLERGSEERPLLHGAREPDGSSASETQVRTGEAARADARPSADEPAPGAVPTADAHDDMPLVIGLSVGGGVAVLLGVVLGVVLGTQGSGITQPSAPMVVGF